MSTARCFTPLVPMDEGYAYEDELQMVNELEEREGEAHALAFIQGNFGPDGYTCTLLGDLDDKFKPDDLRDKMYAVAPPGAAASMERLCQDILSDPFIARGLRALNLRVECKLTVSPSTGEIILVATAKPL
eukprot:tig00021535_g22217.t2